MNPETFTITQDYTEVEFTISADEVSLRIRNLNDIDGEIHDDICVTGHGILPTVLKGLRKSAEALLEHELKKHKVAGFDKSQTIELLDRALIGEPAIMFDETTGKYRLAGISTHKLTPFNPEKVPSRIYAKVCIAAVRDYNSTILKKGLRAALRSSAATAG